MAHPSGPANPKAADDLRIDGERLLGDGRPSAASEVVPIVPNAFATFASFVALLAAPWISQQILLGLWEDAIGEDPVATLFVLANLEETFIIAAVGAAVLPGGRRDPPGLVASPALFLAVADRPRLPDRRRVDRARVPAARGLADLRRRHRPGGRPGVRGALEGVGPPERGDGLKRSARIGMTRPVQAAGLMPDRQEARHLRERRAVSGIKPSGKRAGRWSKLDGLDPATRAGCITIWKRGDGPRGVARRKIERIAPRCPVPFRPRKKKSRQAKFHRCSWCGAQVRRRSARCKRCSERQKHK